MNLKEAFRYQNKLQSFLDYAPPFDVNASFAEAFETYTENAGA